MQPQGWIIYNGYLPGNKFLDFAEWIQAAATRRGVQTKIIKNNELLTYLTHRSLEVIRDFTSELPEFVIFTDKDIYLARQLELMGIPVFNNSRTIEISDNKIATYQILAANNLPIPKTIAAPIMFGPSTLFEPNDFKDVINKLGFPLIIKEAFGSFGEQVYLVHDKQEMYTKATELQGNPFVLQEFISTSYGRDIRLHVTGDKVVAAMSRHAQDDFRANVTAGGTMKPHHPTTYEKSLAIDAAQALDADFAGVDLLFGPNETPLVCEINSNAHIRNIYNCTGVNVAESMIEHVLSSIQSEGHI